MSITQIEDQILNANDETFESLALDLFKIQYQHTPIYRRYVDALSVDPESVQSMHAIPFLPISFFKTHEVLSDQGTGVEQVFRSSGTTSDSFSRHLVRRVSLYEKVFSLGFQRLIGPVTDYAILALLPSYQEQGNSSLVYMVNSLIKQSEHKDSAFFLHEDDKLYEILQHLEAKGQKTLLIGVTYALLDFAERYPLSLHHTTIMETGGMKGRRYEMLREEVHAELKKAFGMEQIASEYGMTELLSQAYSLRDGIFNTSPTLKVLIRDMNDPLQLSAEGRGALNLIDLANLYSCSFIASDDAAELFPDGSFKILGRLDHSDIRGCSLLTL